MSIFRFLGKTVYFLIFAVIILMTTLLLSSLFPFENNYQVKVVLSGSMEPAIHTGSIVLIKPQPAYQVDDVITFGADTRNSIPVTHRITDTTETNGNTAYITKGDANESFDSGTVLPNEVIGSVFVSVPYVGYLLDFMKQPVGFFTLVIIPAALIFVSELFKIGVEVVRMVKRRKNRSPERRRAVVVPVETEVQKRAVAPTQPRKYI
ncbi:signal peptidase I [Candidatus Pacebacteria bacterium]|nr:signal peptidase I [Candidatus Paceibacterota bacterium]